MKIGQGYDVHRLVDNRKLIIGGVDIPHSQGLEAHSDGDVLIHALCDALIGAAGLGDIGHHFPDTDASFKDTDSRELLRTVINKISDTGYRVSNADCTIIAQAPKMARHIEQMRLYLAADCDIAVENMNIKATTTERLGFTGRQEGIAAQAVVLLMDK